MTHLGLFEGIGGFSLAARWMGWQTLAWCEWNEFGQRVLRHHFPEAEGFGDITKTNFEKYHGKIDILTGGFPCQPYSSAGKRRGKDDERHLWPEMLRTIREVSPRYVVGENVLGLVNWSGGLVFEEVQTDLEAQGYEVLPFVLPAAAVGAPHRRDRVWFIAHSNNARTNQSMRDNGEWKENDKGQKGQSFSKSWKINDGNASNPHSSRLQAEGAQFEPAGFTGIKLQGLITNPHRNGLERGDGQHGQHAGEGGLDALGHLEPGAGDGYTADAYDPRLEGLRLTAGTGAQRRQNENRPALEHTSTNGRTLPAAAWEDFPTVPPICGGDDGLPDRLDGISFPKWRAESIKAYGNAIVPQVALQIFRAIQETEQKLNT